jgi:hypothetical protein
MANSMSTRPFEGDEIPNSMTLPVNSNTAHTDTLNLDEDVLPRSVLTDGETSSRLNTHSTLSQLSRIASNMSLNSLISTFEHIEHGSDANSDAVEPRVYDPEPDIQLAAAATASEDVNNGIPITQLMTPNPSGDGHNAPVTTNGGTRLLTPRPSPPRNEPPTPPESDEESESRWSYQSTAEDWDDFTPDDYKVTPLTPPGSSPDSCLRHSAPAFVPSPPVQAAKPSHATCGCFDHDVLSTSTMHSARCICPGSSKDMDDQCRMPRNLEDGLKDYHLRRAHRLMKEAEKARQKAKEIRRRSKEDRREENTSAKKVAESMAEAVLDESKDPTSQHSTVDNWLRAPLSEEGVETACHLVDSNAQVPLSPYQLQNRGLRQRRLGPVNSDQRVSRFQKFFAGEANTFPAREFPPSLIGSAFGDEFNDEEDEDDDDTGSICSNPFEGHEPEPSEPYWIQWKAIPWTDFVPSDFPDGPHKGEYSEKAALRFMTDQARNLRRLPLLNVEAAAQDYACHNERRPNTTQRQSPGSKSVQGKAIVTLPGSSPRATLQGHLSALPERTATNRQQARRVPAVPCPTSARPEQGRSTPRTPTALLRRPHSVTTTPPFLMPPSGLSQPTPYRPRPAARRTAHLAPMSPLQPPQQRPGTRDFSQEAAPPTGPSTRLPPTGPKVDRITKGKKMNRKWR